MQFIRDILHNSMLVAPVTAWFIAQILKWVYTKVTAGEFVAERLVGPGGMPSSHAAMTMALLVMVGRVQSVSSPSFAIATVMTCVVMYDAMGVRWHAGQQAKMINRIAERFGRESLEEGETRKPQKLKEVLGHRPFEVLMGALLGLLVGFIIPVSY